jgi:glycine hydroxymethyltransferase
MLAELRKTDPVIFDAVGAELRRQDEQLEMIASENYVSQAVLETMGTVLTNKYAEGYPGRRYYGGCEHVDVAEREAVERAKKLFKAEHANVQPHSGTQANMAVYWAFLSPGDLILGMDLAHGGHLSHGAKVNFSGKLFKVATYGVDAKTETIDYGEVARIAKELRPKMIVVGASAYPRTIDFARFGAIAKESGALLLADVAHIAGLIAADLHPSPVPHADAVTATTHKTLRGPRGGLILTREAHAKKIDSSVFPGTQGGPLMHIIAAKAVAFQEALQPAFREYQNRIIRNARILAERLSAAGFRLVSGGTDNHLLLVDLRSRNLTGRRAGEVLDKIGITVNKNLIPNDPLPAKDASGIRLGTPALTTRGFREAEMEKVAECLDRALAKPDDEAELKRLRAETLELCARFPMYPELRRNFAASSANGQR